jgi:hypothetical protein
MWSGFESLGRVVGGLPGSVRRGATSSTSTSRIVLQNVQGVCIQPREKVAENIWVDIVERYGQSLAGATCKYSLEVGPSRLEQLSVYYHAAGEATGGMLGFEVRLET